VRELNENKKEWSDPLLWGYYLLMGLTGVAVVLLTYYANRQYNDLIKNYHVTFDKIWKEIKNPPAKETEVEGTKS
jgi:hypothetical protein